MTSDITSDTEPLTKVKDVIQQLVETQIELGILVYDYQNTAEAKEALQDRVKLLVQQYNELNQTAHGLHSSVPLDIVEYIENGRNADVYTREFVELLNKQNQYINGKMKAMDEFASVLGAQITGAYPELAKHVDNVVGNGSKEATMD